MDVLHNVLREHDFPGIFRDDEQVNMPWPEINGRLVAADSNVAKECDSPGRFCDK